MCDEEPCVRSRTEEAQMVTHSTALPVRHGLEFGFQRSISPLTISERLPYTSTYRGSTSTWLLRGHQ